MAPEAPDPKTFESWEDAFEYPIPAVRGMEKQLRRDIDLNREKLRTLVGASYRSLLGTAESIIVMDKEMHNVEAYMSEIGKRCNTTIIEKKTSNLRVWAKGVDAPNSARYSFASQLAILTKCPDAISRLLKKGGSVLLAAKILVISRLLHTRLSQGSDPPSYLEVLRTKLGNLRRRLLNRIERRFKRLDIARDMLVEAMCAYSLATSSSAKDVLRHYHHIRQEAISDRIGESQNGHDDLLVALQLYVKTLRDTQAVIPNQFTHALEKLKSTPLIKNKDISALPELNLDIHGKWIDDDITSFTPFIRHDDLPKAEAEILLKKWAQGSFQTFLDGLKYRAQGVRDPLTLVQLRREIIELWLSNQRHSMGIDSTDALDGLRDVFNAQAIRIAELQASKLNHVKTAVENVIQHWQPGPSDSSLSLWDSTMTSMDMSHGGSKGFREDLAARSLGKTEALSRVWRDHREFLKAVEDVEEVIRKLKEAKWTDEFDDVDDEDDLLDNKQVLLSEDDPSLLQDKLKTFLQDIYTDFQNALSDLHPNESDENCGQKSCFLLRIWREIRQQLPLSYQNSELGFGSILELQSTNAEHVLHLPLQKCSRRLRKVANAVDLPARPLWEGDPPLPNLPSLWTYRLLLDLAESMTACGSDIWSPQATDILKKTLGTKISLLIEETFNSTTVITNGHTINEIDDKQDQESSDRPTDLETPQNPTTDSPSETQANGSNPHPDLTTHARNLKIQTLFDITYLVNATTVKDPKNAAEDKIVSAQSQFIDELALDARLVERMKKDAGEYWKRTSLLFGLLG